MVGLSWPLWVEGPNFPRVPFVAGLPDLPVRASWLVFGLFVASLATATAGIAWRWSLGLTLVLLLGLVAQDQHRLQPWVYQFLVTGLALATVSTGRGPAFARLFIMAMYFHSGLSKLDVGFVAPHEQGARFLAAAVRPFGLDPTAWPDRVRVALILAMPAAELAIAIGLGLRKTRRAALVGAIGLHATLLGILGPWGLNQSPIVLVWNLALIVEDVILFGSEPEPTTEPDLPLAPLARLTFFLVVLLPFGERRGRFDSWPSFAYYASSTERTDVLIPEGDELALPESIRRHVSGSWPGGWRRLDLSAWSRAVRGVPVYPQGRANNGLAEALAIRYRGARAIRVIQWSRADPRTGARHRSESFGLAAIRRQAARYRLNAHPAGAWIWP